MARHDDDLLSEASENARLLRSLKPGDRSLQAQAVESSAVADDVAPSTPEACAPDIGNCIGSPD
jgi:hypothetical protein